MWVLELDVNSVLNHVGRRSRRKREKGQEKKEKEEKEQERMAAFRG